MGLVSLDISYSAGLSSLYTYKRVASYLRWIETIVWPIIDIKKMVFPGIINLTYTSQVFFHYLQFWNFKNSRSRYLEFRKMKKKLFKIDLSHHSNDRKIQNNLHNLFNRIHFYGTLGRFVREEHWLFYISFTFIGAIEGMKWRERNYIERRQREWKQQRSTYTIRTNVHHITVFYSYMYISDPHHRYFTYV